MSMRFGNSRHYFGMKMRRGRDEMQRGDLSGSYIGWFRALNVLLQREQDRNGAD